MSQDVTTLAPEKDVLAGEYVLGTLDPGERAAAQSLIAEDAAFAAKVKVWERRLGELHLMVEPIEPEPQVWARIKARLPEPAPPPLPSVEPEPAPPTTALPEFKLEVEPEPEPKEQRKIEPELPFAFKPTLAPEPEPPAAAPEPQPGVAASESAARLPDIIALPSLEPPSTAPAPSAQVSEGSKPPAAAGIEAEQKMRALRRHLAGWRVLTALMALALTAVVGLLAVWRYAPERVPPQLRPAALMRLAGISVEPGAPPRRPLPPESQFDE
jgi:anti-sigma-K factor RskA